MTWAEMVQDTAKAPKRKHEWVASNNVPMRVSWTRGRWKLEYKSPDFVSRRKRWFAWPGVDGMLAAEIARLAGLTKPEADR